MSLFMPLVYKERGPGVRPLALLTYGFFVPGDFVAGGFDTGGAGCVDGAGGGPPAPGIGTDDGWLIFAESADTRTFFAASTARSSPVELISASYFTSSAAFTGI